MILKVPFLLSIISLYAVLGSRSVIAFSTVEGIRERINKLESKLHKLDYLQVKDYSYADSVSQLDSFSAYVKDTLESLNSAREPNKEKHATSGFGQLEEMKVFATNLNICVESLLCIWKSFLPSGILKRTPGYNAKLRNVAKVVDDFFSQYDEKSPENNRFVFQNGNYNLTNPSDWFPLAKHDFVVDLTKVYLDAKDSIRDNWKGEEVSCTLYNPITQKKHSK